MPSESWAVVEGATEMRWPTGNTPGSTWEDPLAEKAEGVPTIRVWRVGKGWSLGQGYENVPDEL